MVKTVSKTRDMTTGNPIWLIIQFAIPLFIGNIFQQIYSVVDTMIAGYNLGDDAIAAIGATAALYSLIIDFAIGLNSGYGLVVTRHFGASDNDKMKKSIAGMIMLNAAVAIVLTIAALIFLRPIMRLLNTPNTIFEEAYVYIAIICAGIVSTVGYNMFACILRAVGNSKTPLYFLIISCVINISLDILLIMVFRCGIAGAAIATVIAETVSAILCGIYVFHSYKEILPDKNDFKLPEVLWTDLISTGFTMALMLCVVDIGSVVFQGANNILGEKMIAAHTASRRIMGIMMQPLATIATASSIFIGQNWGAKKIKRIRSVLKMVIAMEALWAVFSCLIIYLFGGNLVSFTTGTNDNEIIQNAILSLRFHFALFPALGILLCMRTAMQAMGEKLAPVISSCMELAMKILAAIWLIPHFGFVGTCITEPVTWAIMMMFLVVVYLVRRKKIFMKINA